MAATAQRGRRQHERLLTPREMSEWTGFAVQTLQNWRSQSRGPAYEKVGRRILYPEGDALTWLAEHRVETTQTA